MHEKPVYSGKTAAAVYWLVVGLPPVGWNVGRHCALRPVWREATYAFTVVG